MIRYLYDSRGRYIASEMSGRLYGRNGRNIGHWIEREKIFVNLQGRYLGEIVGENRLLMNKYSPHKFTYFGHFGRFESLGRYEDTGRIGIIGVPSGFADLDATQL